MREATKRALRKRLAEIRADRQADREQGTDDTPRYDSPNGCASCDFRTAANMIAGCYPDRAAGMQQLKRFMQGEIPFKALVDGMVVTDDSSRFIHDFVQEQFADAMDSYYPEWQ